jgi:hypothetical protein
VGLAVYGLQAMPRSTLTVRARLRNIEAPLLAVGGKTRPAGILLQVPVKSPSTVRDFTQISRSRAIILRDF